MGAPSISRWTGEFERADIERAYLDTTLRDSRVGAFLCLIATTGTSLAFAPLDVMTMQGAKLSFFLGDRLLAAVLCAIAMVALAGVAQIPRLVRITHAYLYVFFSLNALVFAHPLLERHGGVFFPLIALSLWMSLPGSFLAVAALSAFAPVVSLIFWGVLPDPGQTPMDLVIIGLLTTAAYGAGAVTRNRFSRLRREEDLHVRHERRINQELAEAKAVAETSARHKAAFLAVMSH